MRCVGLHGARPRATVASDMAETLHLRCGSDIRDSLSLAGIAGDFLEWSDPVCMGPVRALAEADYLAERSAWIRGAWDLSAREVEGKLLPVSALRERLAGYAEICLWFEHDLYDQSILVQLLAALADWPELHPRLRIVTIDRHPELRRFIGLGQLRPEQLAPLYAVRESVQAEAYALARRAWDAWRSPDPTALREGAWASQALPFLAAAFARHLEEFPAAKDGLGLTQRLSLQAIAEANASAGVAFAAQIFGRLMAELEPLPWLGDTMYWSYLHELAAGPHALITMLGEFPSEQLALTPHGEAVLAGNECWRGLAELDALGPSRWRGGVDVLELSSSG